MQKNYGIPQRDIAKAVYTALIQAEKKGALSFSSVATLQDRIGVFIKWGKSHGINKLEKITKDIVLLYGKELAAKVRNGDLAPATAQNYLSAINTVMNLVTKNRWESISPTKDCGIMLRTAIRQDAPGALAQEVYIKAKEAVELLLGDRAAAIIELTREFGLRSKEASFLNVHKAIEESIKDAGITITVGTKGGRKRKVPITNPTQIEALKRARTAQGKERSVMPVDQNWKSWREGELRAAREIVKKHTGGGLHDLRATYACVRYMILTGHPAPCAGGVIVNKEADKAARLIISAELGHGRIDVTNEYLGGRR